MFVSYHRQRVTATQKSLNRSQCSDLQELQLRVVSQSLKQWKSTIPTPKRSVNFPIYRMAFTATPFAGAFYAVAVVVRIAASNWGQRALSRRQSPYSNQDRFTSAGTCPRGSSCLEGAAPHQPQNWFCAMGRPL